MRRPSRRRKAEQLCVNRVGHLLAQRCGTCNSDGGVGQRGAIEAQEPLPCSLPAKGAGMGQRQLGEMEGAVECGLLSGTGRNAGRKAMIDSFACENQDSGERFQA